MALDRVRVRVSGLGVGRTKDRVLTSYWLLVTAYYSLLTTGRAWTFRGRFLACWPGQWTRGVRARVRARARARDVAAAHRVVEVGLVEDALDAEHGELPVDEVLLDAHDDARLLPVLPDMDEVAADDLQRHGHEDHTHHDRDGGDHLARV